MTTYENCRNLVHPPDKTTRLRHRSSRLAGLGPASGWKSQEYDRGPAMFQHVSTRFNMFQHHQLPDSGDILINLLVSLDLCIFTPTS
jgi:hypothetical protein